MPSERPPLSKTDLVVTGQAFRGQDYRVVSVPLTDGGSIRVVRSLAPTERLLASIRERSFLIGAVAVALAALVGWLLALRIVRPVGAPHQESPRTSRSRASSSSRCSRADETRSAAWRRVLLDARGAAPVARCSSSS